MNRLPPSLALLTLATPVTAAEFSVSGTQRFFSSSVPDVLQLTAVRRPVPGVGSNLRTNTFAYQLSLQAALTGRPADALGLRLGLDTGLVELSEDGLRIDYREGATAWEETFGLGETWAELQLGDEGLVLLRFGKLRPRLGGSAVFDAYAFGAYADLDLRLVPDAVPLFVRAHALLPDGTFTKRAKKSPLLSLEFGYEPTPGLELKLLGLLFFDQQDLTAPIFADAFGRGVLSAARELLAQRPRLDVQVARCGGGAPLALSDCLTNLYNLGLIGFELETTGLLGWTGVEAEWAWSERGRVRALALLGLGSVDVATAPNGGFLELLNEIGANQLPGSELLNQRLRPDGSLDVLAGFGLVEAEFWPLQAFSVQGFLIAETGDAGLRGPTDTYNGFLSLAPLLPYTSLFFGGAVLTNLATPVVVSASPDGAGLFGGGLGLVWWPTWRLSLGATGALLSALSRSELSPSLFMGTEIDVRASVWLVEGLLNLDVDTAVFLAGPFFGPETPDAYQVILSASLMFP